MKDGKVQFKSNIQLKLSCWIWLSVEYSRNNFYARMKLKNQESYNRTSTAAGYLHSKFHSILTAAHFRRDPFLCGPVRISVRRITFYPINSKYHISGRPENRRPKNIVAKTNFRGRANCPAPFLHGTDTNRYRLMHRWVPFRLDRRKLLFWYWHLLILALHDQTNEHTAK